MTNEQLKKLQDIYTALRNADKLVTPELSVNYTPGDVRKMDESYAKYYYAIDEVRYDIGKLLDNSRPLS